MRNFKKLLVWQKAMKIVELTYQMTDLFPDHEKFGLTSQSQRSAVSIPSNIAEGSSRRSEKDKYRFAEIALGSAFELETQVLVAQLRQYAPPELIESLLKEIEEEQSMLSKYMERLQ
ncbi:MAG: four helix bundle protein [Saprospiraceae bacterium]|nr:four helix bundle protein [Saprospiraceae bacterium]